MHYCKQCDRIFMLNGHKLICPRCTGPLAELRISYMDYVDMDIATRERFKDACSDEQQLKTMKTTYRMYKYSKWYKELQAKNTEQLPISTLLAEIANKESKAKARKKEQDNERAEEAS